MSDQRRGVAAAATLLALVLLSGCFPGHASAPGAAPNGKAAAPTPPPALTVTPASGATRVPISAEVGLAVTGGAVGSVTLTRAGSKQAIKGFVRDDGTSWVPETPLRYGTSYTATVTARSTDGTQTTTRTSTFRTMGEPARQTGTGLYLFTGDTYGVALPVVIEFNPPVPESARANVQRRLFVSSTPAQPGVWYWASGSQVWYRPPQYWQPGTTLTVRAALAGQPMGGGYYGDVDRSATVRIGQKVFMNVDNATKSMKVYVNDKLVRKIPVSLGKHSTPSSSGHLVVMSKAYSTIFDTTREGPGGYRVSVNYAMRLTWGGEFIHAAPWSVGDQGYRNVSHGCVNMSTSNARWLFGVAHVGDPIDVRGTERQIVNGNGWTAWNLSWAEYIKGSALPVPADVAAGVTPTSPSRAAFR
jgi:lipoprotein-anchoring transpeptidase ErfK/SrfK